MINEAFIQSIVRNVVQRLQDEADAGDVNPKPGPVVAAIHPQTPVETISRGYRARYLHPSAFEERFSVEFDSNLPIELGRPVVCLYEKDRPCDSCGRCEVRGF